MGADPFGMVELKETNPRLFWHNIPRQKPTVWFTAQNSWICLLGRQPRPTFFHLDCYAQPLLLVLTSQFWSGCKTPRIELGLGGYEPP